MDELKSALRPLLDGYLAEDVIKALAEICEEEVKVSVRRKMGLRAGLYERWAVAFRTAEVLARSTGIYQWGKVRRLRAYLTRLAKEEG
jgi:hypothetical protein